MKTKVITMCWVGMWAILSACGGTAPKTAIGGGDAVSTVMVNPISALGEVRLVDFKGEDTAAVTAKKPFPQNETWPGVARPSHKPVEELNDDVILFYEQWKRSYLRNYPGTAMVYINGDLTGGLPPGWPADVKGVSTSEATGYGMVTFALMAGYDPQAKSYFDGLLELVLQHQAHGKKGESHAPMMSWVLPSRFDPKLQKTEGAADGDLDIAYALLLAHQQWGSNESADAPIVKSVKIEADGALLFGGAQTDYLGLARRHMKGILQWLIDDKTARILMGDWAMGLDGGIGKGAEDRFNASSTRPSDWMIGHLRTFDHYLPDPAWGRAIDEIYRMMETVQHRQTGLFPDFVEDVNGVAAPAVKDIPYKNAAGKDSHMYLESEFDDAYNWNACRVPWRLAADVAHFNSEKSRAALNLLNSWSTANIGKTPADFAASVWHGYTLDGQKIMEDPTWSNSLAFTAPMVSALVVDSGNQIRLDHGWDYIAQNFLGDHTEEGYSGYFSDSIALLNLLLISGNWWNPAS